MREWKLDRLDRLILAGLQENGRITNVELAKRVGISAPPCLRRVRALEQNGVIRGYTADVDPAALDYNVVVFAQVRLKSQADADLRAFEETVAAWPEVRECHMLAGEDDFLLRIVAPDWDAYQAFETAFLTSHPNVVQVKSSLCMRSAKRLPGVPIEVDTTPDWGA